MLLEAFGGRTGGITDWPGRSPSRPADYQGRSKRSKGERMMAVQTETMKPAASPRKGRRAGVASELSVLLKVKPGREQQLREHLNKEREDNVQHAEGRKILTDIQTLHEARYVLFD